MSRGLEEEEEARPFRSSNAQEKAFTPFTRERTAKVKVTTVFNGRKKKSCAAKVDSPGGGGGGRFSTSSRPRIIARCNGINDALSINTCPRRDSA